MTYIMTEEERRRAWEAGPTDVDGIVRKADVLIAETRRGGGRGAPAARRESDEFIHALHDDLKSSAEGKRLGKLYSHNPYQLASSLGIAVERVPLVQLQDRDRSGVTITGRLWCLPGRPPFVQVADTLREPEASRVLGHEIGHYLGFDHEAHCDQFSQAFMTVHDDESAAGRWRALDQEALNRERQYQIARSKALAAGSRH